MNPKKSVLKNVQLAVVGVLVVLLVARSASRAFSPFGTAYDALQLLGFLFGLFGLLLSSNVLTGKPARERAQRRLTERNMERLGSALLLAGGVFAVIGTFFAK